ncbi:hypothetical protein SynBIOSU31_02706 [Synechococcus sp. BIOS-U3-1]|uniref:hypothetical protein n=1 Tax=Synechococcus sp. BIOS-U3-1 TaxID=1400865 RepID=UPI001647CAFD|nr:hypothetical protein [Synechococcus sp. BIOS-U3-1]QNI59568.1 hypothetical protein SynBIOSU31_02706 [Synechococcus sp. BIOS-U3-1]
MSRAKQLFKKLDKLLSQHDTFGDTPEAFVNEVIGKLDGQINAIHDKNKPEHWAAIYVERDRARIKTDVLNKVMDRSSR